jgi:glyoxylase-like metal-dependent hydrolase (beta-lactamase superfamily II)
MEVLSRVHMADAPKGANFYMIDGSDGVTLIDVGMGRGTANVEAELARFGRGLKDIKRVIITHAHADHYRALAAVKEATGAEVMAGAGDVPFIQGESKLPRPKGAMKIVWMLISPMMRAPPCRVDTALLGGDAIPVLGGLEVIPLPGHTPGSIGLLLPESKAIFCGDALSNSKGKLRRPLHFKENRAQCVTALLTIGALKAEVVLPGHGAPIRPDGSRKVTDLGAEMALRSE